MDTKNLAAFKAVYEAGSITKAAAQLYITQPGLSKALSKLEAELGHPLFERTHQGVEPTAYARSLYPRVGQLAALLDQVADEAAAEEAQRTLHVASTVGVVLYVGLSFVDDFQREFSGCRLSIEEGSDRRVIELLSSGEVAIGFLAGPVDRTRFDAALFSRHRHVLEVNKDDPLAGKAFVTHADLDGRVVTLLGHDYAPYANNVRWMAEAGAHPAKLVEMTEGFTGSQFAASGQAVCVSTDYFTHERSSDDVAIIPFENEACSYDVYLAWRKGSVLDERSEAFRSWALTWIEEHRFELFTWEHSVF